MRAQTLTLDTVLHRRRWRAERGVLLAALRRGGRRWAPLAQLVGADLPGRGAAGSIRISMGAALTVGLLSPSPRGRSRCGSPSTWPCPPPRPPCSSSPR
jgi:hypothetical protein